MKVEVGELCLDLTDAQVESLRCQLGVEVGDQFLNVAGVAERLGVSREYVYRHADELGAVRLGAGPKARLRFNPAKIEAVAAAAPTEPLEATPKPRRKRRKQRGEVELLAVRGDAPYAGPVTKAAPGGASTPAEGLTKGECGSNG